MIDVKKVDLDIFLKAVSYELEYLISNLMLPGQIENWIIIHNLGNAGLTSLPLAFIARP